ncbi:MAG: aldehyde ferredoxin oxidoreductase family protein [Nitrospirota bacterium]
MSGWHGKALHLDLSSGKSRTETISRDILTSFLGGRGLGVHLMKDSFKLEPYDPSLPLIFAVGPLCGTPAPTSARMAVVSRSPLTGTIFDSSVGGMFALKLKAAGCDCLVVTGKARSPVYLEINDDRVEIKEASSLWGKGCGEVNKALEAAGAVACIGPAGERLVRFANIMVGGANSVGRGGMGAVMGAKNLKAVVVKGSIKTSIADSEKFKQARDDVMRLLRASPVVMGELGLTEYGTAALVDIVGRRRMAPTENFKKTFFPEASAYSGPNLRKQFGSKKEGCAGCPIQCKKVTSCGRPMPEYETLSHFGALNANSDAESIIKANLLCNNLGLDTISTAATIAAYGETRGSFLSPDELLDMVRKIAWREDDGDRLAEGSRRYCGSINRPNASMSVKGLELPAYDPRGSYGMALAYGTSNRGGCHLRAYPISQEILRKPVATDRFSFDGKARLIKIAEDTNAVVDSLAVCKFAFLGASIEEYAQVLAAATGVEYTGQGLLKIGENIIALERRYNAENGFGEKEDFLPERFFTEAGSSGEGIDVPAIDKKRFQEELERYYRIRLASEKGRQAKEKG